MKPAKNSLDTVDKSILTIIYIAGIVAWLFINMKNETPFEWAIFGAMSIFTTVASYKGFKRIWFK